MRPKLYNRRPVPMRTGMRALCAALTTVLCGKACTMASGANVRR